MRTRWLVASVLVAMSLTLSAPQAGGAKAPKPVGAKKFEQLADAALAAMKQKAEELKIVGVAEVSYAEGDNVQGWISKMAVVGQMKKDGAAGKSGSNFLGIAYTKAAEMADTLENSGSGKRPPLTGEYGWQGGVIGAVKSGHVIVSFSGGKSEEDVQVSKAGLAVMTAGL